MNPAEALQAGAEILEPVLAPHGFVFRPQAPRVVDRLLRRLGWRMGSGGAFARGDFVRGDRRLELHFRHSLGLVRYHAGNHSVGHDAYMRALGVGAPRYPGFSDDPVDGFRHLAHDLALTADDFLAGDAFVLRRAAAAEAEREQRESEEEMARSVGDPDRRREAKELFRKQDYARAVAALERVQYPHLMSDAERTMLRIARERSGRS